MQNYFSVLISALIALMCISPLCAQESTADYAVVAELNFVKNNYDLQGPGVNQKLSTDLSSRFKISGSMKLNERFILISSFSIYEISIVDAVNGSKDAGMGGGEVGTRYFINPAISVTGTLEYKKELFFNTPNNTISGVTLWTPRFNAAVYYKLLEKAAFNIIPSLRASLILGGGEKKMGTAYLANASFNYYLTMVRLNFTAGFESRTQKYKTLELTDSGLQFSIGAGMSF